MHWQRELGRRLRTMVTRAKVTLCTLNEVRALLQVQGLGGETLDNVTLHLPFAMSANVPPGGDVVLLMVGATRTHVIALHCDDASLRIQNLQPGEFGWQDKNGNTFIFRQGGVELITQDGKNVTVTSGDDLNVTVAGDVNLNVTGNVDATIGGELEADITGDCDLTVGGQTNLACTGKVVASASEFDLTGNVTITGNLSVSGNIGSTAGDVSDKVRSMAGDRTIYDGHKHGSVQNGSGFSDVPDNLQ